MVREHVLGGEPVSARIKSGAVFRRDMRQLWLTRILPLGSRSYCGRLPDGQFRVLRDKQVGDAATFVRTTGAVRSAWSSLIAVRRWCQPNPFSSNPTT